jgi:hypothetical protein
MAVHGTVAATAAPVLVVAVPEALEVVLLDLDDLRVAVTLVL